MTRDQSKLKVHESKQLHYMYNSWDSIGDDQYFKSDSTVNLLVALSIEMKNRQPSILYSSSGFLCPKLRTFTCQKCFWLNIWLQWIQISWDKLVNSIPLNSACSCLQDDPSRNNPKSSPRLPSVFWKIDKQLWRWRREVITKNSTYKIHKPSKYEIIFLQLFPKSIKKSDSDNWQAKSSSRHLDVWHATLLTFKVNPWHRLPWSISKS